MTTRWRARALDDQLAFGADPMQSDELSLRAGQLGSPKTRRRLACALRGVVALAGRDAYPIAVAAPPIRRAEVRANRVVLLELAERLCSSEPAGAQGLAIASKLIGDRRSPLYSGQSDRPLPMFAFEALVAMDRRLRTAGPSDD
ncbi:MAG TPA: hypothetical protein VFM57_01020 [Thermoleophilaceae bacterium]|nr:hypothetical protein [Thermoleophilaceae bacterium]